MWLRRVGAMAPWASLRARAGLGRTRLELNTEGGTHLSAVLTIILPPAFHRVFIKNNSILGRVKGGRKESSMQPGWYTELRCGTASWLEHREATRANGG